MREIILDTETTGLDPSQGHRIVEIGCLEMVNLRLTGKSFHTYINPERDVPPEASSVTGLTTDFLKPFPLFANIVDDFLAFIEGGTLVIHNARFDMGFLNAELNRLLKSPLSCEVIDTLKIARQIFPGSPASLDALCKRFQIDRSNREKHGALLDAQLLAKIYVELRGGRQRSLFRSTNQLSLENGGSTEWIQIFQTRPVRSIRSFSPSQSEQENHLEFIQSLKNHLWDTIGE